MDIRIIEFRQETNASGKAVDWVCYAGAHAVNSSNTWARVKDLTPPESERPGAGLKVVHMRAVWDKIEPAYKAWKQGEEIPETGTPIAAWPALNRDQVKAMRAGGIHTIEDLAGSSDAAIGSVKLPQMRDLRRQAQAFIDLRDQQGKMDELADLRAQIEELKAEKEQGQEPEAEEAPKKRRGRPPKVAAE